MGVAKHVIVVLSFLLAFAWAAVPIPSNEGLENHYDANRFFPKSSDDEEYVPECCGTECAPNYGSEYRIPLSNETGVYGFFYDGTRPAIVVPSGAEVIVEMGSPLAHGARAEMIDGDPGMESVFNWGDDGPNVVYKGAFGNSGGHYMSGPIYVCGAEPGDVLQVDILDLVPRPNPGYDNKTFGVTGNAACGWHARGPESALLDGSSRSTYIVYELIKDDAGKPLYWEPVYSFRNDLLPNVTTPCVPLEGEVPMTTGVGAAMWKNPDSTYGYPKGKFVPCIDGEQTWIAPYPYSGLPYYVPEDMKDYSVKGKYRIPINFFLGNIGLIQKLGVPYTTAPPTRTGCNMDNRRVGIGATLWLPVEVEGGMLLMGDNHGAQGDGETSCMGVETQFTGKFKVTLHKAGSLPVPVQHLNYPIIESINDYTIQGYSYRDFMREIEYPQINVTKVGLDLNRAYTVAFNDTREFLVNTYNVTEDEAINVMSLAVDFGVSQVVDGIVGVHTTIPKWVFDTDLQEEYPSYVPTTICNTAMPNACASKLDPNPDPPVDVLGKRKRV